jgi:hypothetical protein
MEEDLTTAHAAAKKTDEQSQGHDMNVVEITSESRQKDQVTSVGAQEKGKGKAEPEDAQTMDIAIEHQPEVPSPAQMEEGKGKGKEPEVQGQQEIQDEVLGPAGEMAPPPVPLAQDPSSETVSITASSISNPALEVDNAVSTICS